MACVLSTLTARQLMRESIYTMKLVRRGINIRAGKEASILKSLLVGDFMTGDTMVVPENMPLNSVLNLIKQTPHTYFPVLNRNEELVGIISLRDIRHTLLEDGLEGLVIAKDIMREDVITLTTDQNLYNAMEKFSLKDFGQLPVVDSNNPKRVVGMLTRANLMNAYNKAILKRDSKGNN